MKQDFHTKIVETFKKGEIKNIPEFGEVPKHIETQISHIFLFPQYAYKIYKWDNKGFNQFFSNLGDPEFRKQFYKEDFFWNNYFNKEVYLNLKSLNINGTSISLEEQNDSSDDLVIEMKTIQANENLTKLILHNQLSEKNAYSIGFAMTKEIAEFPHKPKMEVTYYELLKTRMEDLTHFTTFAEPHISKPEAEKVMNVLSHFIEKRKPKLEQITDDQLEIAIDNHSDNLFFKNGQVSFIDAYPPKKDWLLLSAYANAVRPATDILLLSGQKNLYDQFIKGYKDYYQIDKIDEELGLFYQTENALLKGVYLYDLFNNGTQRKDEADKYWGFVKEKINLL